MMTELLHLQSRCLIAIGGDDAQDFLQNVFTNDIPKLTPGMLQYNLLLTPQGQVLHDVFISRDGARYLVDCDKNRSVDLLRRLTMFKLRAKVTIDMLQESVYAAEQPGGEGLRDPRHPALGKRIYEDNIDDGAGGEAAYENLCISLGIPTVATIRYEKDFAHEVNLDLLGAIAWDKGCFIGQEVAARVHHRGLAKKRLRIVAGSGLAEGKVTDADGNDIGEIRNVNETATQALAVLKVAHTTENGRTAQGNVFQITDLS